MSQGGQLWWQSEASTHRWRRVMKTRTTALPVPHSTAIHIQK
jgi:hypothetical protein